MSDQHCSVETCQRPGIAIVGPDFFCRRHFVSACSAQLETYTKLMDQRRLGEVPVESLRRFIRDCLREADNIERDARDLDNLERARLLDLILSAAELGRHLRRSPRKVACIPIELRSKKPREPWQEETKTHLISRHGALTRCEHPLQIDEPLRVTRLDTGRTADARVAWGQPKGEGQRDIGIEFLDCDNFWELDWDALDESRSNRNS
jgi:hypothetical protein